jgi:hypothetical protein
MRRVLVEEGWAGHADASHILFKRQSEVKYRWEQKEGKKDKDRYIRAREPMM